MIVIARSEATKQSIGRQRKEWELEFEIQMIVIARSEATKQSIGRQRKEWIASRSLSSGSALR